MAIFGTLATVRAQAATTPNLKLAFDFVAECARSGTTGHTLAMNVESGKSERVELGNGVFALVQAYKTKTPRTAGFFESHRVYIDVQAMVAGEEIMEVADVGDLKVQEDLTPAKDMIKYEMYNKAALLRLHAGEVAVLFPVDGHMPSIAVAESVLVRKIVVKVPLG